MNIRLEDPPDLEAYCRISIAFEMQSRLDLNALRGGIFVELSVTPRWKDYDDLEAPTEYPHLFDTTNWSVLVAWEGDKRIGGAILARDTPGFDMLQGRRDLAVMVDLRVRPEIRGHGVGRKLFNEAVQWALEHGCVELNVETQETNVSACRFYSAMGCRLASINPHGYGVNFGEAKLVWQKMLT